MIEGTSPGMFPRDQVAIRYDARGQFLVYSAGLSQGQGHETSFAAIVARVLGVPEARVSLRESVPGVELAGNHSGGSRSLVGAGSVCHLAARKLVEQARRQPGKLNYAGYVGGVPQFLGEMLNRSAGINTVMVAYKSTPDALTDLLTNRIQIWFTPVASGIPVKNQKQARMIAVTGDTRARVLPDVPTFKEAGYPDLTVEVAFYLLVAKGTPRPIVDKLYAAVDKALQKPAIRDALLAQGVEDKRGGPDEVSAYLAGEFKRWGEIVKLSAPAAGK